MDNPTVQKLKDYIAGSTNIGIVVGPNPTVDHMAAALSLSITLRDTKKNVVVACPTDPIVEISSLVGIDKVQKSLGGDAGDLVVSFPYNEGEIEKVSYTLENNSLNIIVKAGEKGLSFDQRDIRYTRGSGNVDLLIVVGTPRLSDVDTVFDTQKFRTIKIINIDNHADNQGFGDIVLVSPRYSSVSEIIGDIAFTLNLPIERDAAQNMFDGIQTATQNFQSPLTSSLGFEMAGLLMQKGAMRKDLHNPQNERPEFAQVAQQQQQFTNPLPQQQAPFIPQQQQTFQPSQQDHSFTPSPMQQHNTDEQIEQAQQQLQQEQQTQEQQTDSQQPPNDWLTPKVYTGSSDIKG
jgi:hypothetical protein